MVGKLIVFVMAIAGVPLFAVMALSAILAHRDAEIDLQAIIISFNRLGDTPLLSSLPLFAFGGYLLAHSRAPQRLVRLANALVGWLPGGLAIVAIWASSLVTAITGASGVTLIALGGLLLPALKEQGYPERFSLGLITAGGSLGLLFPPSLAVILYGVISRTSIEEIFAAGVLPSLLMLGLLSIYAAVVGVRSGVPRVPFSWPELGAALREGAWEVPLPIVVVAGIYSGQFTVSEAAVVSATFILLVEVVVYRDVKWTQLPRIAHETIVLVGGILIILGMTMAVSNMMVDEEVPRRLFEATRGYMTSQLTFLVVLNLFLLFIGCMIDIYAAIVFLVPVLVPLAREFGV
ncbi:MAG: TRAP transporter large permease subunit, partial [Planctomycetes bacterium]|nr:TRAP transporter large permease subunit [Planctomycetota bacterium]